MPRSGSDLAGALLALVAFAIFSLHDAIIKILGATYAPVQLVFFSSLAGLPLAFVLLRRHGKVDLPAGDVRMLLRLRSLVIVASSMAGFHAFATLPMAQTYAILFAAPLLIALLAIPMLQERLTIVRLGAILMGLVGVLVVLRPGHAVVQTGHIAAIFCAFCVALVAVLSRKIGGRAPLGLMLIQPMLANVVLLGMILPFYFRPMPLMDVGLILVHGACAFVAMGFMILAYRRAQAAVVAPMQYSQVVWALVYGALLFNEVPSIYTVAGSAIVIASGALILVGRAKPSPHLAPGL